LTPGQAHDGRQFESLYESLNADNILENAVLDKGYDADRIRERLSYEGIAAVNREHLWTLTEARVVIEDYRRD